jgi:hypothetical protein
MKNSPWRLTGSSLSLIIARLYEEIVTQGYTGTQRILQMRLRPFRPQGALPVSKQTVIWDRPPSSRSVALMMVRPKQSRTREQTVYLDQLIENNETIAVVFKLAQDFGRLLRKREGQGRLEQWKATVRASGIAELIAFADGLADDAEAVASGCSLILVQRDGRGVRQQSQMDQTEFLWSSGIPFASTPCRGSHPSSQKMASSDQRRSA